jgi:hypothetical protein
MTRNLAGWMIVAVLFFAVGCSKTTSTEEAKSPTVNSAKSSENTGINSSSNPAPPAAALAQFLEALRTGNDEQVRAMLTPVARQKMAALNLNMPPASDTAKFNISQVKYISHDGAQVTWTWMDLDDEGQLQTDKAVCVLRKEAEGWRVAGLAAELISNEPPVFLNFEDPEDLKQKHEWVEKEMVRRAEMENLQAQDPEHGKESLRR